MTASDTSPRVLDAPTDESHDVLLRQFVQRLSDWDEGELQAWEDQFSVLASSLDSTEAARGEHGLEVVAQERLRRRSKGVIEMLEAALVRQRRYREEPPPVLPSLVTKPLAAYEWRRLAADSEYQTDSGTISDSESGGTYEMTTHDLVLDCSSVDSTLISLSSHFGLTEAELWAWLSELDLDQLYEDEEILIPPDEYIAALTQGRFRSARFPFTRVRWFHLTRSIRSATYLADGILPTTTVLPRLLATIADEIQDTELSQNIREMAEQGKVPNFQFNLKTRDRAHWGPYAMLVRESAFFSKRLSNWDYLGMPEILWDFCDGYKARHGVRPHDAVRKLLKPTIVHFEMPWTDERADVIGIALLYVWGKARNDEFFTAANTCFDGCGVPILPDYVVRVEEVSYE